MGLLNPPTSTAKQPGPNTQTELAVKEFAGIIKSPKHKAPHAQFEYTCTANRLGLS